ncbi:hypothetical protein DFS34DRAFT_639998 [Phlyctochytrium arcticum]|nr:hypothetical protein DFS34DRAFT_639998 [Phlyctochytrium arcticum]
MYSFTGDFKNKRAINLGGTKDRIDKAELLRKTQLERQNRERERLKLLSASKVQAFWRGRQVVRQFTNRLRTEWSERLQRLSELIIRGGGPQSQTPSWIKDVQLLWRDLLFFYNPAYDESRLNSFCELLIWPMDGTPVFITVLRIDDPSECKFRIVTLSRFLLVALNSYNRHSMHQHIQPATAISILLTALNPENYVKGDPANADGMREFGLDVSWRILNAGLYPSIRAYLLHHHVEQKQKDKSSIDAAASLSLLPIRSFQAHSSIHTRSAFSAFISHILTIEILPNRLSIEGIAQFSRYFPFEAVITQLNADPEIYTACMAFKGGFDCDPFAALLGNVLAFGGQRVGKLNPDALSAYLGVLQSLIQFLPDRYLNLLEQSADVQQILHEAEDNDDEEILSHPSTPPIDPRLKLWLSTLTKPLQLIVKSLPPAKPDMSPQEIAHVQRVSNFLLSLMTRWPANKTDLATTLLFRPDTQILGRIWHAFAHESTWSSLAAGRALHLIVADPDKNGDWPSLLLFSELLSRLLLTMGDDEFYSGTGSLPLDQLVDFTTVLKNTTFRLYWYDTSSIGDTIPGTLIRLDYLRELFTRVLQQLHARDSRRPFCPPNHWLMTTSFDLASFTDAVMEESLRDEDDEEEEQQPVPATPFRTSTRMKADRRRPCMDVLTHIPFVITFEMRVSIFRQWVRSDKIRHHRDDFFHAKGKATVRRQYVFEDGFRQLNALGSNLKNRVQITFVDEHGMEEAGVDGGGVFKEFLTALCRQAFDINYGLFQATADQLLYPSSHSYNTTESQLKHLEFLGRILGKALYEGVLVDAAFASFFLAKWLGRKSYLDDLPSLDPELYNGLVFLKNYPGDVEKDLGLTFAVDDAEFGTARSIALIPNGASTPVTNTNRIRYIFLMAHYKLNIQLSRQCTAFFAGLSDILSPKWLQMFNQQELQILLGGVAAPINIDDLKMHTTYGGGYNEGHPTMGMFWRVLAGMDDEGRRALVKFVTSCARPPLLGFKELNPGFQIQMAGEDQDRLPTASTCINLLKLPAYKSEKLLKQKLMYAVHSGAGFDLS